MKKIFCFCALWCCLAVSISAQEEDVLRPKGATPGSTSAQLETIKRSSAKMVITYGVEAGLNYNIFSQDVERSFPIENSIEDTHKSGSGISPFGALIVDFPITSSIGIQIKGLADFKSWSNSKVGDGVFIRDNDPFLTPVPGKLEGTYSASAFYAGFAALLRFNIDDNIFITAGPTYHRLIGEIEREDKVEIVEGDDDLFIRYNYAEEQGQFRAVSRTTKLPTSFVLPLSEFSTGKYNSSRLGIEAGVGYRLNFGNLNLVPQLRYNMALSEVATETKEIDMWQFNSAGAPDLTFKNSELNSLQFSLALMFNL